MASSETADEPSIPTIDFWPFLSTAGQNPARKDIADKILNAFRNTGFLALTNYGIPAAEVSKAFTLSQGFFAKSVEEKESLAWTTPESNRGYSAMGREKVTNVGLDDGPQDRDKVQELAASCPDLKETYEIGREGIADMPNLWPAADPKFRKFMLEFFISCHKLHVAIMRAIAFGLGIDERWFDNYTRLGDNTLRLLHYPAVQREVFKRNKAQVRAGAHTDYGSITLLFQDERGGLQVQKEPGGGWVDVKPMPGACIVNAGDLLARWSNDLIRSTMHQVVEPPTVLIAKDTGTVVSEKDVVDKEEWHPARYSIAYFCNPDFDRMIDAVPGTLKEGETKKYKPINSGDYLVQRLSATY